MLEGGGGQQATYLVAKQDAEFPQDWLVIIIDWKKYLSCGQGDILFDNRIQFNLARTLAIFCHNNAPKKFVYTPSSL